MSMSLICSLSENMLQRYVAQQLNTFFPDNDTTIEEELSEGFSDVMQRLEYCFTNIKIKYYVNHQGRALFNHLNSDQYCTFLYFLANQAWKKNPSSKLAAKAYVLNKLLHGLDLFYDVCLPDIFILSHPVGTVLGRAKYSNYLVIYQNVTIGSNVKGEYPEIGEGVAFFCNAKLIGNCKVGSNVSFAAGTLVMDSDIPANKVVFGAYPDIRLKAARRGVMFNFGY